MGDDTIPTGGKPSIGCNLGGRELAERKEAISRDLFVHAEGVEELPDGVAYRFPAGDPWPATALEFIAAERRCCRFFTFELVFEPNGGPLWLRLRGSEEIKAFVLAELDGIAPKASHATTPPKAEFNLIEQNKEAVRRLIDDVMNAGRMDVIDQLYSPTLAPKAKRWIAPFRASFPDLRMVIVDLIATSDTVVGRFTCSGTHLGEWLGHAPTGRRFESVDEVYIFRLREGRIVHAWGLEDTLGRLEQLGLR